MKKHVITFGDSLNYQKSLQRIESEIKKINYFDSYKIYTEKDIPEFISKHNDFIFNNKRGFGYWIWKSYITYKYMETMEDDDILLYLDCGCSFNINDISLKRLDDYFDLLKNSEYNTLSFELEHKEKTWTKKECYNYFNISVDERYQLVGGIFLTKKNNTIFKEIIDLINEKKYYLFDDTKSQTNDNSFIEHRHDQSIFSLLRKQYGTFIIKDETYYAPNWSTDGFNYPIHAKRLRE